MSYKLERKYKREAVNCATCGKEFCVLPSTAKRNKNHYCSKDCGKKGRKAKKGKIHKCAKCGKNTYVIPCRESKNKSGLFYCSQSCHFGDTRYRAPTIDSSGYVNISLISLCGLELEMAKRMKTKPQKYSKILEHRLIYAMHLGRPLLSSEIVHHKDGEKANNALPNLQIMSRRDHTAMHKRVNNEFASVVAQNKDLMSEVLGLKLTLESIELRNQLGI